MISRFELFVLAGVSALLIVFAAVRFWSEMAYALWGREADATLINTLDVPHYVAVGGRSVQRMEGYDCMAVYRFTDAEGVERVGKDILPGNWVPPPPATLQVVYTPGRSRLRENPTWPGLGVWLAGFSGFIGMLVVIVATAHRALRPTPMRLVEPIGLRDLRTRR